MELWYQTESGVKKSTFPDSYEKVERKVGTEQRTDDLDTGKR